jgi:hypothetical protein
MKVTVLKNNEENIIVVDFDNKKIASSFKMRVKANGDSVTSFDETEEGRFLSLIDVFGMCSSQSDEYKEIEQLAKNININFKARQRFDLQRDMHCKIYKQVI